MSDFNREFEIIRRANFTRPKSVTSLTNEINGILNEAKQGQQNLWTWLAVGAAVMAMVGIAALIIYVYCKVRFGGALDLGRRLWAAVSNTTNDEDATRTGHESGYDMSLDGETYDEDKEELGRKQGKRSERKERSSMGPENNLSTA